MSDVLFQLLEGQSVINGRYSRLQRIVTIQGGGGNFSLLFRAYDAQRKNDVALKFDHPFVGNVYRHECFERESTILSLLRGQANILPLVDELRNFECDVPTAAGVIKFPFRFIAVELAEHSVFDYIYGVKKESPLRHLRYFREVCKGVQRLHREGICHRDLKPQNCLIMKRRVVVVGDLGTAKTIDGRVASPPAPYEEPVGDKRYTAPELLCRLDFGDSRLFAADKYSLGSILFEMFSKSTLSQYLYSIQTIDSGMILPFGAIPVDQREAAFHQSIGSLEAACPLPDIVDCAPPGAVPECIRIRLDRLYKDLAYLDYRKRTISFEWIFQQLDIMIRILIVELARERRQAFKRKVRGIHRGVYI